VLWESDARWELESGLGSRGRLAVHNDGGSSTLLSTHEVTFAFRERQIAGLGAVGRGETIEDGGGIAHDLALQVARNLSGGKGHIDEIATSQRWTPDCQTRLPHKPALSQKRRAARSFEPLWARKNHNSGKSPVDLKNFRHYKDGGIEFNPNFATLWLEHFASE
jgi:hypothetical protein